MQHRGHRVIQDISEFFAAFASLRDSGCSQCSLRAVSWLFSLWFRLLFNAQNLRDDSLVVFLITDFKAYI